MPEPIETVEVFFDDRYEATKVYKLDQLPLGHRLQGPCIIMDKLSTILVECQCQCTVTAQGNLRIDVGGHQKLDKIGTKLDTVQLSVFSHRFMSIPEHDKNRAPEWLHKAILHIFYIILMYDWHWITNL